MNLSGIASSAVNMNRLALARSTPEVRVPETPAVSASRQIAVAADDDYGAYAPGKVSAPQDGFRTAAPNAYVKFMPTREGFSSNNLALAVTDPAAEPFSAGKTKAEVSEAARKAIDVRYDQMRESGKPFKYGSFEGVDERSAFGDLDRRALNAIATDKTGIFSEEEKGLAKSFMADQQGLAMGLYAGPIRLAGEFAPSHDGSNMAVGKAGVLWLDKLSLDEKSSSADWMVQRAGCERLYRSGAEDAGQTPEELSSGFSFIEMLLQAYKDLGEMGPPNEIGDVPAYHKAMDLFETWAQATQAGLVESTIATASPSVSYYL